jgi:hypothetical protein
MERIGEGLPVGVDDEAVHHGARRASPRMPLDADVELLEPRPGQGLAINVSAGGIRVAVDAPLTVGEHCMLKVSSERVTIEHARVVWVRQMPDGWLAGLEFTLPH